MPAHGDGNVRGILSVDISNWQTPGFNGKKAVECTWEEIKEEVWNQIKPGVNTDEFGTVWRRTAPVAMDQPFAYITGSVS